MSAAGPKPSRAKAGISRFRLPPAVRGRRGCRGPLRERQRVRPLAPAELGPACRAGAPKSHQYGFNRRFAPFFEWCGWPGPRKRSGIRSGRLTRMTLHRCDKRGFRHHHHARVGLSFRELAKPAHFGSGSELGGASTATALVATGRRIARAHEQRVGLADGPVSRSSHRKIERR